MPLLITSVQLHCYISHTIYKMLCPDTFAIIIYNISPVIYRMPHPVFVAIPMAAMDRFYNLNVTCSVTMMIFKYVEDFIGTVSTYLQPQVTLTVGLTCHSTA